MNGNNRPRALWASRFGFVLAAAGSAIGLGNIWKFPYITGKHGGGVFVLVYLACIILVGIPILMAELLIGRQGRRDALWIRSWQLLLRYVAPTAVIIVLLNQMGVFR